MTTPPAAIPFRPTTNYIPSVGDVFCFAHHQRPHKADYLALRRRGNVLTRYVGINNGIAGREYGSDAKGGVDDDGVNNIGPVYLDAVYVRPASPGERAKYGLDPVDQHYRLQGEQLEDLLIEAGLDDANDTPVNIVRRLIERFKEARAALTR